MSSYFDPIIINGMNRIYQPYVSFRFRDAAEWFDVTLNGTQIERLD